MAMSFLKQDYKSTGLTNNGQTGFINLKTNCLTLLQRIEISSPGIILLNFTVAIQY